MVSVIGIYKRGIYFLRVVGVKVESECDWFLDGSYG